MDIFPINPARLNLKGSAKSSREDLRAKLTSFEGAPEVIVFTPQGVQAAWVLDGRPHDSQPINPERESRIIAFWLSARTLTGVAMPGVAPVISAAARTLLTPESRIMPCTVAFPEDVFTTALARASQHIRKDFPLIGTDIADQDYVVFWDLRSDIVKVAVTPRAALDAIG